MAEPYIADEQEADFEAMQLLEMGLEPEFELSESEPESQSEYFEEEEEDSIPVVELDSSPEVLVNSDQETTTAAENRNLQEEDLGVEVEEERNKRRRVEKLGDRGDTYCSHGGNDGGESSQSSQSNRSEIDGLFCPICMEAWTSEGDHHICCLPCGHLFGLSCIEKWLRQRGRLAKCPQCNRKSALKDVRKLFAPRIAVVDEESQKRIRFLEEKCASFVKKDADMCKKETEWKRREAAMQLELQKCKVRTTYLEHLLGDLQSRQSGFATAVRGSQGQYESGNSIYSDFYGQRSSSSFMLQRELRADGARLFDIDASGQILLLARRVPMMGGSHLLTKMSLIPPHDSEDIFLPPGTKIIKDLHISPYNGSLALFASLGKKLSNGSLLVFDMRRTAGPVESRLGLTTNPIHTVHSLKHISTLPSGVKAVVSASSIGMCQWNFGGEEERPFSIPETTNQGVCISLAYCTSSDDIVVSYRPRVELSHEAVSQPLLTPSLATGQGVLGSHLHLKRLGSNYEKLGIACATVSDIRLPKSSIIDRGNQKPLFAAGDEAACGLILQELPSFTVVQRLKSHQHFIYDVKSEIFEEVISPGVLIFCPVEV
ncbi:unnamed protein product [Dovyalis caffra]|uniref:RING-type domain-containing protein n=1 Tax=Dovyalis caffra TaxID=77055 RepID=A0AAV1S2Q5_9ROSI|nr:unnamed protein product [Dovyalis caffra]